MALRLNTIEYAFTTRTTSLATATRHNFAEVPIFIPEVTSRTFRSVILAITARSVDVVNVTAWTIGILLQPDTGAPFNDSTVTTTITNTGEQMTWHLARDVTSYFESNFGSSSSQNCQAAIVFTGPATINITAKLIITYEYDDTDQTTLIKTIRIPLDSPPGSLTNVLTEIGTNQVPNLSTFAAESSKTFRDIFFEISANEVSTATTDFNLAVSLDAEGEVQDGSHEQGANSSVWYKFIWKRTDMDTTAVHAFKARATVTSRMNMLSVVLIATYEYAASSDNGTVSIMIPYGLHGGTDSAAAGDRSRFSGELFIEEGTTLGSLTLLQSGVLLNFLAVGAVAGLNVICGSQTARAYTHESGTTICGQGGLIQRIDSSGAAGLGIAFDRGKVNWNFDVYHTDTIDYLYMAGGALYLNYSGSKPSDGWPAANKTIFWGSEGTVASASLSQRTFADFAPNIPEADYYMNAVGFFSPIHILTGSQVVSFKAEIQSTDTKEEGWEVFSVDACSSSLLAELSVLFNWVDASKYYKRYPNDWDPNRLDIETSRGYRMLFTLVSHWEALGMFFTYHSIKFTVSGQVFNASNLTRVTVEAHRSDTGERIGTDTVMTDETYQIPWYDNTIDVYAHAREADTGTERVGRSATGRAR